MTTTRPARVSICAASVGVAALYVPCGPAADAFCACPNAPNSTFVNDRFMARHMMIERMRPEDPSSAPAVMSNLFSSTQPIATAERPAYEFKKAITVGMSAPPLGRAHRTPDGMAGVTSTRDTRQRRG